MRKCVLMVAMVTGAILSNAQNNFKDSVQLDEVVITGNRFETPVEKSGKTIYKISSNDIEQNAGSTLLDLLNNVPGLQMDGNYGTPGSNVSYYLRGGRNRNTLVLIDGIPMNDPTAITAYYDLRYLSIDQVESIEILNGGLSTLYGSGAAAGIINIKLKSAGLRKFSGTVDVNGGSYNAWSQHLQVNGTVKGLSYLLSGNNATSEGFSSAKETTSTDEFDNDGYTKQNALLKLGFQLSENWTIDMITAYDQFSADYDDGAFLDADNVIKSNELRFGITPYYSHGKGNLTFKMLYNQNENEFKSTFPQHYEGTNLQLDLTEAYILNKNVKAIIGVNAQHMSYRQIDAPSSTQYDFTMLDPYVSFIYDTEFGLNVHAGARLNTHSVYKSKLLYNLNPSYLFDFSTWKLKLRGSVSTSYITPSLYQIYSEYGSESLSPEESVNYEGGFDVYLSDKFTFNAVYFEREENELIDFVSLFDDQGNWTGGIFDNVQDNRLVKGYELNVNWKPAKILSVDAYYTHSETDTDETYYRIPNDKWALTLSIIPIPNMNLSINYQHTDKRKDFDYTTFSEITMNEFDVFNVNMSYSLFDNHLKVYGALNNITNAQNIGVHGFNSMGRNVTLGIKYSF